MVYLEAVPAYGRDYTSKAQVMADWDAEKDFLIVTFGEEGYINKPQLTKGITLMVRYQHQTKVMSIVGTISTEEQQA